MSDSEPIIPATLTFDQFQTRVGATFSLAVEDGDDLALTLTEAKALGQGQREGGAFSLVFVGSKDFTLEQGNYLLKDGEFAVVLFMVPIGPWDEGMGYESVFT